MSYRTVKSLLMPRLVALQPGPQKEILLILMVLYLAPGNGFIGLMNLLAQCTFAWLVLGPFRSLLVEPSIGPRRTMAVTHSMSKTDSSTGTTLKVNYAKH